MKRFTHLSLSLAVALVAVLLVSCQTTETGPKDFSEDLSKKPVALLAFNQEDLSEVVKQLSQKMDCQIVLDDEVAGLKHVYVDYRLRRSATLGEVLDEINDYIRKEHKLILRWKQKGDKIIIYKFA